MAASYVKYASTRRLPPRLAQASEVAVREALSRLLQEGRPTREGAIALGATPRGMRLSKFEPCLPPRLEAIFTASVLTDAPSARALLKS